MRLKIFHAFLSRLLFFSHGLVAVWHVVTRMQNPMYWGLMTGVITLGIEGFITVRRTEKGEWKWFSPMIFLYLCTIISCIWILELGLVTEEPHICNSSKGHAEHHGLFPLQKLKSLNEEAWVAGIEQSMMLVLVIGRWLMPSAGMTSEQLYQLLLMDSGLGADMLDLIDAFKESGVEISRNVRIIGLTVFSWSLMQFPLALTQANDPQDSDSDEDASAYVTDKQSVVSRARKFFKSCMSGEMWSLFIIIGMQDGPSLVFRMYLLIQEKVRSQMMIFFIGKHFISIVFEVYRIVAVIRVINEQEASPLTIDDGQMKLQCINKTLCQAQLSRLMFFIHGVVMVWRVVWVKGDKVYWALAIGVCLLIIESFITLRYTSRGEWKWFSPSVFLYLCSVLPCVWILELNTVEFVPSDSLGSAHRRERHGLSIPKEFDTTIWTTGLEQSMLFILVLGRWLMPAGELSEDQLSQLLMMYIGMGADILELFEPFKEPDIKIKYRVLIFGLSVFSWAFLQFPIVLTQTTSVATNQYDVLATEEGREPGKTRKGFLQTCFSSEMWSNIVTVGMLDGPFFIYRVYALAWGKMENQMTIFFACKNFLSVVFVIYMVSKNCCKTGDTDT